MIEMQLAWVQRQEWAASQRWCGCEARAINEAAGIRSPTCR